MWLFCYVLCVYVLFLVYQLVSCFLLITSVLCSCPFFFYGFFSYLLFLPKILWIDYFKWFLFIFFVGLSTITLLFFFFFSLGSWFQVYNIVLWFTTVCHQAALYHYYQSLTLMYFHFSPPSPWVIVVIHYTITYMTITTSCCYVYLNNHYFKVTPVLSM